MIWGFRNPRKPRKLCSDLDTKKPGGPRKPSGEHENLKRRDLENLKSLINLTVQFPRQSGESRKLAFIKTWKAYKLKDMI